MASSGCSRGAIVSSRYSAMAFDSNSETLSSRRSTGTFLCGEMARNQSGRLSRSMWRNSKSIFFSRRTMAARCTQGQVLKLTRRYLANITLHHCRGGVRISQCRRVGFAGADAQRSLDRGDEDLAVPDLPGLGSLGEDVDQLTNP